MKVDAKKVLSILLVTSILVVGIAIGGAAGCAQPTQPQAEFKTLKIGCIMPFSGPYGFYGEVLRPPLQAYADILNERGGVKIGDETYLIQPVFVDDKVDPAQGPIAAQELVNRGCVANVGRFSDAAPIDGVLSPAKIFDVGEIKPGYDINDYPYFIGGWDSIRGNVGHLVGCIEKLPDVDTIGYLCYDWQSLQADGVIAESTAPGTVLADRGINIYLELVPMGQTDFTIQLTKFADEGVDFVFTVFGPGDYAIAVKQSRELGYGFYWLDPGSLTDVQEFISICGYENAQGVMYNWPCPWEVREQTVDPELIEIAREINDRVTGQYGASMGSYMGQYDWSVNMCRMLLSFYEQAGTIDPDVVMEFVQGGTVKDFTGTWTMGGQQAWGSPRVKPIASVTGIIQGYDTVYFQEHSIPIP